MKTILVTGGYGFIGSAFIRLLHKETDWRIINVDKMTYAAQFKTLGEIHEEARLNDGDRYVHYREDIAQTSSDCVYHIMRRDSPFAVVHFAAESHVERTAQRSDDCVRTNIVGTHKLLEQTRRYLALGIAPSEFRFLHVSTDEVFGEVTNGNAFTESTAYAPRSPYAAAKAAADHIVHAWWHTYQVPTINTNCTNNFGPWQLPDKLVPLILTRALRGDTLPIHGNGANVRDWLYVDDHARALLLLLTQGVPGKRYCIGGDKQLTNLQMTNALCQHLDTLKPRLDGKSYVEQICFVKDRLVNDSHYAVDCSKIKELGWKLSESFESSLEGTVLWYLENGGVYAARN